MIGDHDVIAPCRRCRPYRRVPSLKISLALLPETPQRQRRRFHRQCREIFWIQHLSTEAQTSEGVANRVEVRQELLPWVSSLHWSGPL